MDAFTRLNAQLDGIIQFHELAILAHGRVLNPLYDPAARDRKQKFHRIGEGTVRSVPLSRIVSTQVTVHGKAVNRIKALIKRGGHTKTLPTVQRSGRMFLVHDGNHRLTAALRAGKRVERCLVQ